jgi:hypothetical protein
MEYQTEGQDEFQAGSVASNPALGGAGYNILTLQSLQEYHISKSEISVKRSK